MLEDLKCSFTITAQNTAGALISVPPMLTPIPVSLAAAIVSPTAVVSVVFASLTVSVPAVVSVASAMVSPITAPAITAVPVSPVHEEHVIIYMH